MVDQVVKHAVCIPLFELDLDKQGVVMRRHGDVMPHVLTVSKRDANSECFRGLCVTECHGVDAMTNIFVRRVSLIVGLW